MDDIIIFRRIVEEHWDHVSQVLRKLRQHGIEIAWTKMGTWRTGIEYIGIRLSEDQNYLSPSIPNTLFDLISVDCSKISS